MAYTTIDDSSAHFQTALYTGTGSSLSITNDGNSDLQPDVCWIESRSSSTYNNILTDSTRGSTKVLTVQGTDTEANVTNSITSYNTDGFTLGTWGHVNYNGVTYVAWQWKVNGGTTSSNTDGTISTTIQTNSDAGFSICRHDGNGTAGATFGHGLGVKPSFIISKRTDSITNWRCYHSSLGATKHILLNTDGASVTSTDTWNNTEPTSSVVTVGSSSRTNASGSPILFYVFAEKQGFSKFGSYVGNGSTTDGPFVYTGFKPAFVMIKATDAVKNWTIFDNKRYYNGNMYYIYANSITNEGESPSSGAHIDFLSNGFKIYDNWTLTNQNTVNYIYMAFAENPFVTSTGIPTTAR